MNLLHEALANAGLKKVNYIDGDLEGQTCNLASLHGSMCKKPLLCFLWLSSSFHVGLDLLSIQPGNRPYRHYLQDLYRVQGCRFVLIWPLFGIILVHNFSPCFILLFHIRK